MEDDAKPSTSGTSSLKPSTSSRASTSTSTSTSSGPSTSTSTSKPASTSDASRALESENEASSVKVSVIKEKANGKQFIKERPKLPAHTLKKKNADSSSSDEGENIEEDMVMPEGNKNCNNDKEPEISTLPLTTRYPKREGQPRVNYAEAEVPDDDHFICKCSVEGFLVKYQ